MGGTIAAQNVRLKRAYDCRSADDGVFRYRGGRRLED